MSNKLDIAFLRDVFLRKSLLACILHVHRYAYPSWEPGTLRTEVFLPSVEDGFCSPADLRLKGRHIPDPSAQYLWAMILRKYRKTHVDVEPFFNLSEIPVELLGGVYSVAFNRSALDSSSKFATKEFFDRNDLPAWDTIFGIFGELLLFYVPNSYFDLMSTGIDANCMDVIRRECVLSMDLLEKNSS